MVTTAQCICQEKELNDKMCCRWRLIFCSVNLIQSFKICELQLNVAVFTSHCVISFFFTFCVLTHLCFLCFNSLSFYWSCFRVLLSVVEWVPSSEAVGHHRGRRMNTCGCNASRNRVYYAVDHLYRDVDNQNMQFSFIHILLSPELFVSITGVL